MTFYWIVIFLLQISCISATVSLPNKSEILSGTTYAEGIASSYSNAPRGLINILQPNSFPYDSVYPALSAVSVNSTGRPDLQEIIQQILKWQAPILAMAIVGFLLAISFPLCGCCFLCCRCCGNCGAKSHMYPHNHEMIKCSILSILLFASLLCVLIGTVFVFLGNEQTSQGVADVASATNSAFTDAINFVNDTVNAVEDIAVNQLDQLVQTILNQIRDLGNILAIPIEDHILPQVTLLMRNTSTLANTIDHTQQLLDAVNVTSTRLQLLHTGLMSLIVDIKTNLTILQANCTTEGTPFDTLCNNLLPDPNSIQLQANFSQLPTIDSEIQSIKSLADLGIEQIVTSANSTFHSLSSFINDLIANSTGGKASTLSSQVQNIVTGFTNITDDFLGENGIVNTVKTLLTAVVGDDGSLLKYNNIRKGTVIGITCLILLFVLVTCFGLFCGLFGYTQNTEPSERSSLSNTGAKVLMSIVGLTFCFGGTFFITSALLFLLAAPTQLICNELKGPEYNVFNKIIDNNEAWGGSSPLSQLTSNFGIELNITKLLRDCENNATLWQVLKLNNLVNLSNIEDIVLTSELLPDSSNFTLALNLSSVDIIPASLRPNLVNFNNSGIGDLDFNQFRSILNTSLLGFDITEAINNLTMLSSNLVTKPSLANQTENVVTGLYTINNMFIPSMEYDIFLLQTNLSELESLALNVQGEVSMSLTSLDTLTSILGSSNITDIIHNIVNSTFTSLLNTVDDFVDSVVDSLQNKIGQCSPIHTIYTSMYNAICQSTLNGLNGFWFALGWIGVSLITLTITTPLLYSYLRRADTPIECVTDVEYELYPNLTAIRAHNERTTSLE